MNDSVNKTSPFMTRAFEFVIRMTSGVGISLALAAMSVLLEPLLGRLITTLTGRPIIIPAVVIVLFLGMAFHPLTRSPIIQPGVTFSVKKLLRIAIACLGLKIVLADIIALGPMTALIVILSMAATIVSGFAFARFFGRDAAYGAIAGGATAVCGASAALAISTVVPNYPKRDSDTVLVVLAVNALSTIAMIVYPMLASLAGFDDRTTGILLGATIHDVAQVVQSGYSVSETAGASAVIVKLFRVFLLLPVVLGIGFWFARGTGEAKRGKVPVPVFAIMFLVLALINSTGVVPAELRSIVSDFARWGLLIAIAALGLGTSVSAILSVGWRHITIIVGTTLVIFMTVFGSLLLLK